jgi:hypothetical protein
MPSVGRCVRDGSAGEVCGVEEVEAQRGCQRVGLLGQLLALEALESSRDLVHAAVESAS